MRGAAFIPGHARAFWVESPGRGAIREEAIGEPGRREVLVRALYSGVSRGTEALVFRGEVPETERERMRAPFQAGDFPAPVKYGYANVGVVERGPRTLRGSEVLCLHPHQSAYVVPTIAVHPLPRGVPASRAVLAPYVETAVNGLWDAAPRVGDRVCVVGAGALGCAVAWLVGRIPGCEVELVDLEPAREVVARALGVRYARPEDARGEADLVVHTSASPGGLRTALGLAGFEATVLELSWFGTTQAALALGEAFHARRLTLRSSQVGAVATARRARWDTRRRMALALDLLRDPTPECLVTGEDAFEDLPAVMARLAAGAGDTLCHRIRY
jgi:threonine dehydrogenase-like Zn-dependent dehydrogenase